MAKNKPKAFWKYVRSRLKTISTIPSLIKSDGSKATRSKDKADTLNNFFASVFTVEDSENIPDSNNCHVDKLLSSLHISPETVKEKLDKLDPNKSPGHDRWHPFFLKNLADSLCIPLSILFNKSLKEGAHKSWLKATVTPIYKKGIKNSPGNYRPVSMTSVISKLMESILRDEIMTHVMQNNLLSNDQHGFVPGRDCLTQLLLCLEHWTSMVERGEVFDVVYTDFAKAFDSVAHERLLSKINNMGIQGDIHNWIRSFLCGRTQAVNVDGVLSEWLKVISGVPQGSVIGPLLFVIFINDLPDEVKHNLCKLFADDCKLYGVVEHDGEDMIQDDINHMESWSKRWQLMFNASKCKVMHFGYSNPRKDYVLYGEILEQSRNEKDLGVIIDDTLKFHVHAAAASKKANQILGVIKKAYTTRDPFSIRTLYESMVRPHLEYGNAIWGPFYQGDIKKIEAVQRRATKLIPELRDIPYGERLTRLKLPSLLYRRKRGDMIVMYKIMNGQVRLDKS